MRVLPDDQTNVKDVHLGKQIDLLHVLIPIVLQVFKVTCTRDFSKVVESLLAESFLQQRNKSVVTECGLLVARSKPKSAKKLNKTLNN